jgi:hypothetical protein
VTFTFSGSEDPDKDDHPPLTPRRKTIMLHKLRIALAMTVLALAAVSAVDSASAGFYREGDFYFFGSEVPSLWTRRSLAHPLRREKHHDTSQRIARTCRDHLGPGDCVGCR